MIFFTSISKLIFGNFLQNASVEIEKWLFSAGTLEITFAEWIEADFGKALIGERI